MTLYRKPICFPFIVFMLLLTLSSRAIAQDLTPEVTPESTPEPRYEVGDELTIDALLELEIEGSDIIFERVLENGENYSRYIASYESEGNKINGLLTIPFGDVPEGGFKAIVFNHGYIPPTVYRTTERYVAYVDELARAGFVVFKIDMRGHDESEGEPEGSYFSPGYTIDAISALKSLQKMDIIDPDGIGMWGHSMAGNLTLRAMLIEPDIKAGVIWAGAVYSYDDFIRYSISDPSYTPPVQPPETPNRVRRSQEIMAAHGRPTLDVEYWRDVSLTEHIDLLENPVQLHHSKDDNVVNIGYSVDLSRILTENGKPHEFYEYEVGGHNIASPAFEEAMRRTVEFFRVNL